MIATPKNQEQNCNYYNVRFTNLRSNIEHLILVDNNVWLLAYH